MSEDICLTCGSTTLVQGDCPHCNPPYPLGFLVPDTDTFDLHAAIKRLAEIEWECLYGKVREPLGVSHFEECSGGCNGTGCIVPFALLRVECPCITLIQLGSDGINHWYDEEGCKSCYLRNKHDALDCFCRGCEWVPEPDVEKACWRLWKQLGNELMVQGIGGGITKEEFVLRAAEAWVEAEAMP